MEVLVPNRGTSLHQRLPLDLSNPEYRKQWARDAAGAVSRYVSAEEWAALAHGINESIRRHHYSSSRCAMLPMFLTLGVCFCPMLYYALTYPEKVRSRARRPRLASPASSFRLVGVRREGRGRRRHGWVQGGRSPPLRVLEMGSIDWSL